MHIVMTTTVIGIDLLCCNEFQSTIIIFPDTQTSQRVHDVARC